MKAYNTLNCYPIITFQKQTRYDGLVTFTKDKLYNVRSNESKCKYIIDCPFGFAYFTGDEFLDKFKIVNE